MKGKYGGTWIMIKSCEKHSILHKGRGFREWIESCKDNPKGCSISLNLYYEILCVNRIRKDVDKDKLLMDLDKYILSNHIKDPERRCQSFLKQNKIKKLFGKKIHDLSEELTTTMFTLDFILHCVEREGEIDPMLEFDGDEVTEANKILKNNKEGSNKLNFNSDDGIIWFSLERDFKKFNKNEIEDPGKLRDILGAPMKNLESIIKITINGPPKKVSFHTPTLLDSNFYYYHDVVLEHGLFGRTLKSSNFSSGVREVVSQNFPFPEKFYYNVYPKPSEVPNRPSEKLWIKRNKKKLKKIKQDLCKDCYNRLYSNAQK